MTSKDPQIVKLNLSMSIQAVDGTASRGDIRYLLGRQHLQYEVVLVLEYCNKCLSIITDMAFIGCCIDRIILIFDAKVIILGITQWNFRKQWQAPILWTRGVLRFWHLLTPPLLDAVSRVLLVCVSLVHTVASTMNGKTW